MYCQCLTRITLCLEIPGLRLADCTNHNTLSANHSRFGSSASTRPAVSSPGIKHDAILPNLIFSPDSQAAQQSSKRAIYSHSELFHHRSPPSPWPFSSPPPAAARARTSARAVSFTRLRVIRCQNAVSDVLTRILLPAQQATCSCGKQSALHCTCDKAARENAIEGPRCSCRARPAGECTCDRAATENMKPTGSTCQCGVRPAGAFANTTALPPMLCASRLT